MKASVEKARQFVAEADRLMREASSRLAAQRSLATDVDSMNAEQLFSLASNTYAMGAIEYQRCERGEETLSPEEIKSQRWLEQLHGHLGTDVRAALEDSKRRPKATAQDSALQAQAFAENVRDLFARAQPELFDQSADPRQPQDDPRLWSVGR